LRYYVWTPGAAGYVDELLLIGRPGSGGTRVALRDRMYHVIAWVGWGVPNLTERYEYNPYGERIVLDKDYTLDADGESDFTNPLGHQGLRHDAATGLIHNRARMRDPIRGRWLQRDPAGYVDGYSLYTPYHLLRGRSDSSGLAVDCPGGEWWVSGARTSAMGGPAGYSSSLVTFTCKKRIHFANVDYCCCGHEFTKARYKVPTAKGRVHGLNFGAGLGGSYQWLLGSTDGAPSSDDLSGPAWSGISADVTAVVVGGGASTSPNSTSGSFGAGTSIGGQISITTGGTWTTIYVAYHGITTESLGSLERRVIRDCDDCDKEVSRADNSVVRNPSPERPSFSGL